MAKLGEICAFQSGGTPSKNKPEYFGGEIPWISTTALNGDKINEADAVTWITPKAIRENCSGQFNYGWNKSWYRKSCNQHC